MTLLLDQRIDGLRPLQESLGLPAKPEQSGRCWHCWCDVGAVPFEKFGRVFCCQEHMRAFYGSRLPQLEWEALTDQLEAAHDTCMDAENDVLQCERDLEDAEESLQRARREVDAVQHKIDAGSRGSAA